jgi:hypothetical protein
MSSFSSQTRILSNEAQNAESALNVSYGDHPSARFVNELRTVFDMDAGAEISRERSLRQKQ